LPSELFPGSSVGESFGPRSLSPCLGGVLDDPLQVGEDLMSFEIGDTVIVSQPKP
jgi:hypothetical protein